MTRLHRNRRSWAFGAAGALVAGVLAGPGLLAPAQAATTIPTVTLKCATDFGPMDYPTAVRISAARTSASAINVTVDLDDLPGIVPVALKDVTVDAEADLTVEGAAATVKGSQVVAALPAKAPIPVPTMKGAAATSVNAVDVELKVVRFTASGVKVTCTPSGTVSAADVPVAPAPVVKVASTTKPTVKVTKKKVATVSVTVAGGKVTPTGKVTIVVKKGTKLIKKGTVSLKKGKASLRTKKLKQGKYAVTVSYAGSSAHQASRKKVTFKVK